jgi:hypothetical protein
MKIKLIKVLTRGESLFQRGYKMIVLNGKKFARNDKEFTESLFKRGGSCVGFYKVNKRTISLLDMQKNKVGVIANKVVGLATKLDNGRWWYSYGDIPLLGNYEWKQQREDVDAIYDKYDLPIKY